MPRDSLLQIRPTLSVVLTFLVLASSPLAAQDSKKINITRMKRDLGIMESILDKLMGDPSSGWEGRNGSSVGIYSEGYGAIFKIAANSGPYYGLRAYKSLQSAEKLLELTKRRAERADLAVEVIEEQEEGRGRNFTERMEEIKNQMTEFLGNYADAIGQLKETDRVTVLVSFGKSDLHYSPVLVFSDQEPVEASTLEVTARKRDIVEFRRGRINEDDFRQRLRFHERAEDDKQTKSLDIMANIMNTAMSKKYHKQFGTDGKTDGLYVDGLGVLFFTNASLHTVGPTFVMPPVVDGAREGYSVAVAPRADRKRKSKEELRKLLEEYEAALLEVVGDYGHTLRSVKPTELVLVTINFGRSWGQSDDLPERVIMRIRKKDLDAYNQGDIRLEQLRREVEISEF